MKIVIIGKGRIGTKLSERANEKGWGVKFYLMSDGIYNSMNNRIGTLKDYESNIEEHTHDLNGVFLAIPTFDDGKTAFGYMEPLLERRIPVVSCEKGSLANYFSQLKKWLDIIGRRATVGGGTEMLARLEERKEDIWAMHAVINGTINYVCDRISKGRSLDGTMRDVKRFGFAEPGAETPLDVVNGEMRDIAMKIAIIMNICGFADPPMRESDMRLPMLTDGEFRRLVNEIERRRYIVSIERNGLERIEDIINGFMIKSRDWIVSGGFRDITTNQLYSELNTEGANNALIITTREGAEEKVALFLKGPGAGPGPTTSAMMIDAMALFKENSRDMNE